MKDELELFKVAYSVCLSREKDEHGNPVPVKVSWEQMFRRWMDNVGRFDSDVKKYVDETKKMKRVQGVQEVQTFKYSIYPLSLPGNSSLFYHNSI